MSGRESRRPQSLLRAPGAAMAVSLLHSLAPAPVPVVDRVAAWQRQYAGAPLWDPARPSEAPLWDPGRPRPFSVVGASRPGLMQGAVRPLSVSCSLCVSARQQQTIAFEDTGSEASTPSNCQYCQQPTVTVITCQ